MALSKRNAPTHDLLILALVKVEDYNWLLSFEGVDPKTVEIFRREGLAHLTMLEGH